MCIDPLISKDMFQPQTEQSVRRQHKATDINAFEQLLNSAAESGGASRVAVEQANALLKLAQLQLLQGLFANAETTEGADLLAALNWQPQTPPAPLGGQRVEEIYHRLQPTLLEAGPAKRNDIERMIDQVAEKVSLAPELIRSVVAAESNFQSDAVSHAGAQGLMQLMPETAAELGVTDSFDPEQNLLAGSRYLKQLLEKYAGDLDRALAAYNWGQGNVDRKGLTQMPEETRQYLARVKGLLDRQA